MTRTLTFGLAGNVRAVHAVALVALSLAGCGDDQPPPGGPPVAGAGGEAGAAEGGAAGNAGDAGGEHPGGAAGDAGGDDPGGAAGDAGSGGTAGQGGSAGSAGSAGGGLGGSAGTAGTAALGGSAGTAGTGALGGSAGTAGTGALGGSAGFAGSAGVAGTGGTGPGDACIKVAPDGDDATAEASSGALPFRNVQPAIDFADQNRNIGQRVCVAGGANCGDSATYAGPTGADLTMRNGISVHGHYESTEWTRCATTRLIPGSAKGVSFGSEVDESTTLDGFIVEPYEAPSTAGVTAEGASGTTLNAIAMELPPNAVIVRGVDASAGSDVSITNLTLNFDTAPVSDLVGLRVIDSHLALLDGSIELLTPKDGVATGIWLEDSPYSTVEDSFVSADGELWDADAARALTALVVSGGQGITVTGTTLRTGARYYGASDQATVDVTSGAEVSLVDTVVTAEGSFGEGAGVRSTGARITLAGAGRVEGHAVTGVGWGVELDASPDSSVLVPVAYDGEDNGDGENGATTVSGVRVRGASSGITIDSDVTVLGVPTGSSDTSGIWIDTCGGIGPTVTGSVTVSGHSLVSDIEGIRVSNGCDVTITSSVSVVGRNGLVLRGIHCRDSAGCRILGSDVTVDNVATTPGPTRSAVGIRCAGGGCAEVRDSTVTGLLANSGGCNLGCTNSTTGMSVDGNAVVARNVIQAGCADVAVGLVASGNARVENNVILGRGDPGVCLPTPDNIQRSIGVDISGLVDLHSNTITGGGEPWTTYQSCVGAGLRVVAGSPVIRNNILNAGRCPDRHGVFEAGSDPAVFENNDLDPTGAPILYLDEGTVALTTAAAVNALSDMTSDGNFSADPLISFPTDVHLDPASPCIDVGTTTGVPTDDMDGDSRSPTFPDVGADEWGDRGGPCSGVACSGHGSCQVVEAQAACNCQSGYQNPQGDPLACVNVDECTMNNGGCDPLTTCTDTDGSRTCGDCPSGYGGNGETGCTAQGCGANPCQNGGTCSEVGQGYQCSCPFGIRGQNCELTAGGLSAGTFHLCAVFSDGSARCFGSGTHTEELFPGGPYTAVAAGPDHSTCALREDGSLICWDSVGTEISGTPSGTFQSIASGTTLNRCGVRPDNSVTCWGGTNSFGEATPPNGQTFRSVAVGLDNTCGVHFDDTVTCWGSDAYGQSSPPAGSYSFVKLGVSYGCGLASGALTCWGRDQYWQSTGFPSGSFFDFATGDDFGCAIRTNQTLECWGNNAFGKATPPSGSFIEIAASSSYACARRPDDVVVCWGNF